MSKNTFNLKIARNSGVLFDDKATSVNIPTESGYITVLPNHIPLLSIIKKGTITINKEEKIEVESGIVDIRRDIVKILLHND